MHEVSLIKNIFSTLEEEFPKEELDKISTIHLKLGKLSNAEPVLMQNAFKAVTESENRFTKVTLEIEVIPIKVFCDECNQYSIIENYSFKCRYCGKQNNNITEGDELLISKVVFKSRSLSH